MFYSSPQLPDWPKQRQISQTRAHIPVCLVAGAAAKSQMNASRVAYSHSNLFSWRIDTDFVNKIFYHLEMS